MRGERERSRELVAGGRRTFRDAGLLVTAGGFCMAGADAEFRAGDVTAEERVLREGLEELEALGDRGYYPTVALCLAECLYRQGRDDQEVERLCEAAREATGADDLVNFVWLDMVQGCLLARRGEHEEAEACLRRAVALAETTDFYPARSYSWAYLAEVIALSGRVQDAAAPAAQALAILENKGDVAGAARDRERLVRLGIEVG